MHVVIHDSRLEDTLFSEQLVGWEICQIPSKNHDAICHEFRAAGWASTEQLLPTRNFMAGAGHGDVPEVGVQKVQVDAGYTRQYAFGGL